jgi:N-methylhydantoinase A
VILPKWPGITSAYGCLVVDARHDLSQTFIAAAGSADIEEIDHQFEQMESEAVARLAAEGFATDAITTNRQIDMRYLGQWRSLTIDAADLTSDIDAVLRRFHEDHQRTYSYSRPDQPVEIYGLRVAGIGTVPDISQTQYEEDATVDGSTALIGSRPVYFEHAGGYVDASIYAHNQMPAGFELEGPAIIEQMDSTIVVPPSWSATTDAAGNVILTAGTDNITNVFATAREGNSLV